MRDDRPNASDDAPLMTFARAIAQGDQARVSGLLAAGPELALTRLAVGATRRVKALLDVGADREAINGSGSTAIQLAIWTTGRGGTGSADARAQQLEILRFLQAPGMLKSFENGQRDARRCGSVATWRPRA